MRAGGNSSINAAASILTALLLAAAAVAHADSYPARVLKLPDIREKLVTQGAIPVGNTPAEFADYVRREMGVWGRIARQVGLKPD